MTSLDADIIKSMRQGIHLSTVCICRVLPLFKSKQYITSTRRPKTRRVLAQPQQSAKKTLITRYPVVLVQSTGEGVGYTIRCSSTEKKTCQYNVGFNIFICQDYVRPYLSTVRWYRNDQTRGGGCYFPLFSALSSLLRYIPRAHHASSYIHTYPGSALFACYMSSMRFAVSSALTVRAYDNTMCQVPGTHLIYA